MKTKTEVSISGLSLRISGWTAATLGGICLLASLLAINVGAQLAAKAALVAPDKAKTFATAEDAAKALIDAAEKYDSAALDEILGPGSSDILHTGEPARDREQAKEFAKQARTKEHIDLDRGNKNWASLVIGESDWPFPVPIVKKAGKWSFDAKAGREEILRRRIGRNELDAMEICRGYVEAQHEFALAKREGYGVHEYAQHIISTPGQQDGLAWRNADGTWGGPVGEKVASAIERGYTSKDEPYHGYFFKVLKGQGPDAPMGQMDFVVKGVMIGGFALIASPAQYRVTGVKSFIVSHDGVVYEKDLGPDTLKKFKEMERFNPDKTWNPVEEQ